MKTVFNTQYILCRILLCCLPLLTLISCKKFLDKKPDNSLVLISSLDDVQKLLDRYDVMTNGAIPGLLEMIADDYSLKDDVVGSLELNERKNYLWTGDAQYLSAWNATYQNSIYYANVILDELPKLKIAAGEGTRYNQLKGAALFFRAWAFYHLAQLYCQPYDGATLQQPGIVLKKSSAILEKLSRSTVQQTYEQIRNDLLEAANLLPENDLFPTRPVKAAAFGALARMSLSIRQYAEAGRFADSCLKRNSQLLDYNTLDSNAVPPFKRFNSETVFFSILAYERPVKKSLMQIDPVFVSSYAPDDLRRGMFLNQRSDGSWEYNGTYEGGSFGLLFGGIATDEMYLVKAESEARAAHIPEALHWLDQLLKNRWKAGSYQNQTASTPAEALALVLKERRKELLFRGVRWSDLRRFNLEGTGTTLKRMYNGNEYTLPPGDARWVLLIPDYVIGFNGITQNPR